MASIIKQIIKATEGAYVRGGEYADTPQRLADNTFVDIKYSAAPETYREGLLKFDISALEQGSVTYTVFSGGYVNMESDRLFDIYRVSPDWDAESVTYNTMPKGELLAEGVSFFAGEKSIELSSALEKALAEGESLFSIRIVPHPHVGAGQTRINFRENDKPFIMILAEKPSKHHFEMLDEDADKNAEIWAWAQKMFDEWNARYKALPPVNENAKMIVADEKQYTKTNYAAQHSTLYNEHKKLYRSRTFEAIDDLDKYVDGDFASAKLDVYGGIMIESLKAEATGFFRVAKINGRWWMIDPLGYPYISIGLSHINYSLNGSQLQKENALKKYGTFENWAVETTKQVRDELNFNNSFSPRDEVRNVEDGLPYMAHMNVMSAYGASKGVRGHGNGSTVFIANNTMPVFDPDFEEFAFIHSKKSVKDANDPKIIGYTTDNELPMELEILDHSLAVDHLKPENQYTYACAWTWLCNMLGTDDPSIDDVTDELRDLFRGFVYDRYFNVVSRALKAVDSNHINMGCRFLTKSIDSKWVYRFAAQYLDCMTINWYFAWEPQTEALYGIERNGDLPFMVTEFYSKAGDSGLGNTAGAGFYVATQKDRADFYENFTLKLLEGNNCIGWQLFHYMDNDPNSGTSDASSVNSNKGIYTSNYELYTDFADRLKIYNKNVYKLVNYFQNK